MIVHRTALDAAQAYFSKGWAPIPVPKGEKNPNRADWSRLVLAEADLPKHFSNGTNIGLLCGAPSNGLTDIDLDTQEAIAAADVLLPPTAMVHGRAGKPRSHRWYHADPMVITQRFFDIKNPGEKKLVSLVEIRSSGAQTIVPISTHPDGEPIEWETWGEPARHDGRILLARVSQVAAAAILGRHWAGQGARHDAALALSGVLLRGGWAIEEAELFLEAVARAAGDDEVQDRVGTVQYTAKRLANGQPVTGIPRLVDLIDDRVFARARGWLGLVEDPELASMVGQAPPPTPPPESQAAPGSSRARQQFRLLTADEVEARPEPTWLVDGLLVANSLASIAAAPASFKTFLALDIALCVSTGTPWQGRSVQPGVVVYVSAEGSSGMGKRIKAWKQHNRMTVPDTCRFLLDAPQFLRSDQVDAVLAVIAELPMPPALIVIDTLSRCFVGADENMQKDMGLFVAAIEELRFRTGACVLPLHHVGLGTGKIRGSSVLSGALDTIIELKRDESDPASVQLKCSKQKDAEEFATLNLRRKVIDLGNGESSLVLVDDGAAGAPRVNLLGGGVLKAGLLLLERFGPEGATWSEWLALAEDVGVKERSFANYRATLIDKGFVVFATTGGRKMYTVTDEFLKYVEDNVKPIPSQLQEVQTYCKCSNAPEQAFTATTATPLRSSGGVAVVAVEINAVPAEGSPAWGCPDCGERSWGNHGDEWVCRGPDCGSIWSTRRAGGELVRFVSADGSPQWEHPARLIDVVDDPERGGRHWAVEGSLARYPEDRLQPTIEETAIEEEVVWPT